MKRSSSAPCLAENEQDNQRKRIKESEEDNGPNTREYLQLALAKVLQLQRSVNDDTCFDDAISDFEDRSFKKNRKGDADNDEDLMSNVLAKVFRDLPGSSNKKITEIIDRGTRTRQSAEMERIRGKGIQLSGYETCRRVAVDFMRRAVKAEKSHLHRSIDDFSSRNVNTINYDVKTRMLTSLDLHLVKKQQDYTLRLMRH